MASRVVIRTRKVPRLPDVLAARRRPPQPRFLDDVLGVGDAAEHAVGDPGEYGPVLFEDLGRDVGGH